jgi:hypothetical protein
MESVPEGTPSHAPTATKQQVDKDETPGGFQNDMKVATATPSPRGESTAHDTCEMSILANGTSGSMTIVLPAEDSPDSRRMYLFSRLFYRKGPWFRLDDVYSKYYVRSKPSPPQTVCDQDGDVASTTDNLTKDSSPADGDKTYNPMIDQSILHAHLEELLPRLFLDIGGLLSSGMIRFFEDEAECGKAVGNEVLTTDERSIILTKLGAGKKRPMAKGEKKTIENEVWKQMRQQQLSFTPNSNERRILPVRHHIADLILDKLSKVIFHACCRSALVPAHPKDPLTQSTVHSISKMVRDKYLASSVRCEGMCFRLREAPVQTLQRCVRLYLCATSGPGDMRGSGTNGWRSIRTVHARNIPMAKVIPPPGEHTWHQIQYPGLSLRFGLSSACFLDAYVPLTANRNQEIDSKLQMEQVFSNKHEFVRWETCVELRANVDYLVELTELLRSDARRRALGKTPRHKNDGSVATNGTFDCMALLSHSGREAILNVLVEEGDKGVICRFIDSDIQESLTALETESEKVLGVIGVMALHVLRTGYSSESKNGDHAASNRPWLRHMSWCSCLAYLLFDIM